MRRWSRRAWLAAALAGMASPAMAQMAPWASPAHERWKAELAAIAANDPVSYTHLTLPTICSV